MYIKNRINKIKSVFKKLKNISDLKTNIKIHNIIAVC